jgi:homocysteine S-methyltransferase
MIIEFNNQKPLILDGGMGQTLIKNGMIPQGTLWSATALLDSSLHQMVIDAHQDFMRAGAKVITTNNFTVRKLRFSENNILDKFDEALHTAGLLAKKANQQDIVFKDVLIAGSIPTRNQTYMAKFELSLEEIFNEFQRSGEILNDYVDIFYLDVFTSLEEIKLALKALKKFQKKFLIGVHIKKNSLMDDGHCISQLKDLIDQYDILGLVVACTDQSAVLSVIKKIQNLQVSFGFKVNAFANIPDGWKIKPGNPSESLGVNKSFNSKSFISFAEKCRLEGASILGGCCEVLPSHIKALADFYNKN